LNYYLPLYLYEQNRINRSARDFVVGFFGEQYIFVYQQNEQRQRTERQSGCNEGQRFFAG
jgi:hypothetical protein